MLPSLHIGYTGFRLIVIQVYQVCDMLDSKNKVEFWQMDGMFHTDTHLHILADRPRAHRNACAIVVDRGRRSS